MPRIVIPDDEPPVMKPSKAFSGLAGIDTRIFCSRPKSAEDLIERIQDAEAVINIRASSRFTRAVLSKCSRLRLLSIWGTGTDHVDLEAARALGIGVTNTPGVSAVAVAEHTWMLIMAVARRITTIDALVRQGQWPRGLAVELRGKTLGLVGTGAIGRHVATIGCGIGMKVIAWTFHPNPGLASELGLTWVALEQVFRKSDVVSIHIRHSKESDRMIRREHFQMMKPGALFVNTARGAIADETALIEALQSGQVGGCGLDVFSSEPLPMDSPLLKFPNVILTPHSAGNTAEATEAGISLAIENVFKFWEGHPQNVVV